MFVFRRIFMRSIAIVMGSDSDLNIMRAAADALQALEIPFVVRVLSAHRTPDAAREFARSARGRGFGAIIAAAGKAAHLAGAIAANTTLPVIGVPIKSSALDGLDALLSTVQMPPGMPVATVAIDGARNAALLAAQMLAIEDADIAARLSKQRAEMTEAVLLKDADISSQFAQQ
jgi:5-(carboxyamino)imidazole ribonucleotide mutase